MFTTLTHPLLLIILLLKTNSTSLSALYINLPYRAGIKALTSTNLAHNHTYNLNFDIPFNNSVSLLPPALGIAAMDFVNPTTNTIFFTLDPDNSGNNQKTKFILKLSVGPINSYHSSMKIHYFVCIMNDPIIYSFYIFDNVKTLVRSDSSSQTKTYEQPFVSPTLTAPCVGLECLLGGLLDALDGLLFGTGAAFLGNQSQAIASTTVQNKIFINKLDLNYSGPWSFSANSQSNNLSSLLITVSYSDTIQADPAYNLSIIMRNTSYSTASLSFKFDTSQFIAANVYSASLSLDSEKSSVYYMIGVSEINMSSSNTYQTVRFSISNSTQYLLQFQTIDSFNRLKFQIFGFAIIKCTTSSVPYLLFQTQECFDSCPNGYYHNSTSFCLLCAAPCVTCDIAPSNCTSCDSSISHVLVSNDCVVCSSGTYFYNTTIPFCKTCPMGCTQCQNDTYCISCDSSLKYVLSSQMCNLCGIGYYFYEDPTSPYCKVCPTGCTVCNNESYCTLCDHSSLYYLNNNLCDLCNYTSKYFDSISNFCSSCSLGCLRCISGTECLQCDSSLSFELVNKECFTCIDPQVFTKARKCQTIYKINYTLLQNVNTLQICSIFNTSSDLSPNPELQQILNDYKISLFIDNIPQSYQNAKIDSDNSQICIQFNIQSSLSNIKVQLIFSNTSNTDRIINLEFNDTFSLFYIHDAEKKVYNIIGQLINGVVEGSSYGVPALMVTSSMSLFMGFIQFAEITSLYIFMNASIPYNFKLFLETIMTAQECQLLPFTFPNFMENNTLEVTGNSIYSDYSIDLYFIRGNIASFFETLTYIGLYSILFLCFAWLKSSNKILKFFQNRTVKKFYSNCFVSLQAVQLVFVFSASATVTSKNLLNWELIMNRMTAVFAILIFLGIPITNIVFLFFVKQNNSYNTQDSYPAIERQRRGAQQYTFFRILCLLSIAAAIPLIHYVYVVWIAILMLCVQLWYLFYRNLCKYRILKFFRILHTLLFMFFNILYQVYYILEEYFPNTDAESKLRLGNVSMATLLGIYVIDLIQAIIDIGDIIYEKMSYIFCRKKKFQAQIQIQSHKGSFKEEELIMQQFHQRRDQVNLSVVQLQIVNIEKQLTSGKHKEDHQQKRVKPSIRGAIKSKGQKRLAVRIIDDRCTESVISKDAKNETQVSHETSISSKNVFEVKQENDCSGGGFMEQGQKVSTQSVLLMPTTDRKFKHIKRKRAQKFKTSQ